MAGGSRLPRLMLVTDRQRTRGRELLPLVVEAARGGVGIVQVRERDLDDVDLRALVFDLREALPDEVLLVVNGNVRVARTLGVGLHLPAAMEHPGTRAVAALPLVGRAAHDPAEASVARDEGSSYVVLGTIFATESKPGRAGAGVELVREVVSVTGRLPLFGIGGISAARVPEVIHAGAHGVAVCGAILAANHPRRVAEALRLAVDVSTG